MRIRRNMVMIRFMLSLSRGHRVMMSEVCQIFLMAFPLSSVGMIQGEAYAEGERELRLEVFREIMADCRREAMRWETI